MEDATGSLIVFLAEALDGIGTLQVVDGEDVVFPDGGNQNS